MRRLLALAVVALAVTVTGACGSDGGSAPSARVEVFGPYRGAEADAFAAGLVTWGRANGIDVRYTGSGDFVADLEDRVANADPPDVAVVPQPGLVRQLATDGELVPLEGEALERTEADQPPAALAMGEVDGVQYGIPMRVSPKGLVWYRPSVFAGLGLEPPTTLDELDAVVAQIEDAGLTPWCEGIEAQRSTGWAATDWVEDLVVRDWGTEVYGQWIDGTVGFADPRIEQSFAEYRELVLAPGRPAGGLSGVLGTSVQEASGPLFDDPVGCVLHHQASFAVGWMPSGTTVGGDADVSFFVLPARTATTPPLVVGLDQAVAFSDRPEVQALMAHLATADAVTPWVERGGFISPLRTVPPELYPDAADRLLVEGLRDGDPFVVDASDAMDPAVGTTLFWGLITDWIAGRTTYDDMAAALDAARAAPGAEPAGGG